MKRYINCLAVMILLLMMSRQSLACSCRPSGPACQAAWGGWVKTIFLGKVEKIERSPLYDPSPLNLVTIAVQESYRGSFKATSQVYTAINEAACGYSFQVGETYVVFAGEDKGHLSVSLCSATRPARYAETDITYLRSIAKLGSTGRVYGDLKRYTYDPNFKATFQPSIMDHYRPPEEKYRAMAPMPGTAIRLKVNNREYKTVVDGRGDWAFENIEPGPYSLEVDLPRHMVLDPGYGIRGVVPAKGCSQASLRAESDGHFVGHVHTGAPLRSYYLSQIAVFRASSKEVDLIRPEWQIFPDDDGSFDIGPLPPGEYYLAAIIHNKDLDVAAVFFPGTEDPRKATILKLGDGEKKTALDFSVHSLHFKERPTCCEFKISIGNR